MRSLATLVGLALVLPAIVGFSILLTNARAVRADDDHGDSWSVATPFEVDTGQIAGEIDSAQILFDLDYFSLETRRGVRYTFVLELVTVEDANILVVNSAARGAQSSPDQTQNVEGNQKTVEWTARTTDTYFIEVSGTRDGLDGPALLGAYTLSATADTSLEDRHSDGQDGASPIDSDNVYQGAINPWTNQPGLGTEHGGDDYDYFSFEASRGVKYTVDVDLGTAEGVGISILKPTGGTDVSNDGMGASLEWTSPASATYFITVSGSSRFQDSIGTYSLKLSADTTYEDRHSQSHTGATPLSFGNAHQGAVSPEGDRDVFSFQATRGVWYSISAELGTAQGIELSVEDPDGDTAASNGGVGTGAQWIAPANGLFFIVAAGSSQVRDPVGTYSLLVDADTALGDRHGETGDDATPLSFGNEHQGALSPANDHDYFSFAAKRGVIYSIGVTVDTAEGVEISVVKPDGRTEVSNGGVGTGVEWTANATDTFFVAIAAPAQVSDPIGTYSLKVEADVELEDRHGDDRTSATSVTVGSTYQAAISPEGDHDYFSFRASRGVKYIFDLTYGTTIAVSLSVDSVGGGPGTGARNYGEGTDVVWIAPDNDNYFVAVSGSPRIEDTTGTYWLKISADVSLEDRHGEAAAQATQIVLGNAMAGAVSPGDDYDYFFLDAVEGEEYIVVVQLGTAEAVRFSVNHALEGFTVSNDGSGTILEWKAPITGRYILVISAASQLRDPTGTYRVTVGPRDGAFIPMPTPTVEPDTPTPTPTGPALIVESRTGSSGATVRVPVVVEKAPDLSNLSFTLSYDPSVAEVVDVLKGPLLLPDTFFYDDGDPGIIRLLGFASTTGSSSGGSAVVVVFSIMAEEGRTSPLTLSGDLASDSGGGRLLLDLVDGELTVGQAIAGDGNGDGEITALDALIALRMFEQLSPEDLIMDVNGDGRVTPEDARQILVMARPA